MYNIKKGDIILVHSHNFTAKLIQFGMNVERWLHLDFSPFWGKIYNHAAICISDGLISEALSSGITINLFEDAYPKGCNKEILIFRPDWTKEELGKIYYCATKYEGVRYQFWNFVQYIPKILFGIWLGKTHKAAKDTIYCTEYDAIVANDVTNGRLFPKYWKTSPNDIYKWCVKNTRKVYHLNL